MSESGGNPYIAMAGRFASVVPHIAALGIEFEHADKAVAVLKLPWQEKLVGNIETGHLHGGVLTTLIDTASGLAVFLAMAEPRSIATLDLRIDYLRPATAGAVLYARAECYRLTRSIAFVRAQAHHGDESRAVANSVSTFMLDSPGAPIGPRAARNTGTDR